MSISALVTAILSMLEGLLPAITSTGTTQTITTVITALEQMLPFIIQEVQSLAAPVQNIIAALSANPATTAQQLKTLQALDAQVDQAFAAAAGPTDAGN